MKSSKALLPLLLLPVALAALACSDSPSEPRQNPVPPQPPPPVVNFNVSVAASPAQIAAGGNQPSTITVQVRRADNGQPPANLQPVTLTTTLGGFGTTGGPQSVELQLVNGQAQAVLFPGADVGTATVRATFDQSSGFANVQIGQTATFFVAFVDPGVGDPQGGETATIHGGGFDGPVRVTFGTAVAQVLSVSPDRIRVRVPSSISAGVNVPVGQSVPVAVGVAINVNEPVGQASDTLPNGFVYAHGGGTIDQPQIFSVTPATGTNDGGTTVTINGSGFQAPVQVFFEGGTPRIGLEAIVQSTAANRIVVTSPPARGFGQGLQNQTVDIRVKNLNTGFETVRAGAWRFGSDVLITAVGPTDVVYNVPTIVTIQGQGFDEPLTATLAGVAASIISVSGTQVVVRSPVVTITNCNEPTGPIGVVNIETGDGDDTQGDITFRFRAIRPVITSIVPNSGPGAGGNAVTINGSVGQFTGFDPPVRVVFGDRPAAITSTSPGAIGVIVPAFNGTFNERACNAGGGVEGMEFVPTAVAVTVTNLNTGCADTVANGYSYIPADTSCRVEPPPPPDPPTASFASFSVGGNTVQFTDTSGGTPTSWQWDFTNNGSFDSSLQNPQFTFPAPGTYATRLRVTNAGGSDEVVQQVTVP